MILVIDCHGILVFLKIFWESKEKSKYGYWIYLRGVGVKWECFWWFLKIKALYQSSISKSRDYFFRSKFNFLRQKLIIFWRSGNFLATFLYRYRWWFFWFRPLFLSIVVTFFNTKVTLLITSNFLSRWLLLRSISNFLALLTFSD